jgi:hypothetical protein
VDENRLALDDELEWRGGKCSAKLAATFGKAEMAYSTSGSVAIGQLQD